MAELSVTQMQLVNSPIFLSRVQFLLAVQARVVLEETGVGATHDARARYASQVLAGPAGVAGVAAVTICGGPNLLPPETIIGEPPEVDSSANDAEILSQIATFWNALAGIDSGS